MSPWGEPQPINWRARAEKAEAELEHLKSCVGTNTFKIVADIKGKEILGSINIESDNLFNSLSSGFECIIAPVLHPTSHNIRWIQVLPVRLNQLNEVKYYPTRKTVDTAVAMMLVYYNSYNNCLEANDGTDASPEGST